MDQVTWEEEFYRLVIRHPELVKKELKGAIDDLCRELGCLVIEKIDDEVEWVMLENGGVF